MKYYTIILLAVFLTGCQNVYNFVQDEWTDSQLGSQKLYYSEDFDSLDSYVKIAQYIKEHVTYDPSDDPTEHKDPEVTLSTGKGACGDISVLFINIAYFGMKQKMSFVTLDSSTISRSVVEGGKVDNAMVYYDGKLIEPQSGIEKNATIGYIYDFDEVFGIY